VFSQWLRPCFPRGSGILGGSGGVPVYRFTLYRTIDADRQVPLNVLSSSTGAAKSWRTPATAGTRWDPPSDPPLTKSLPCDAELPPATPSGAAPSHLGAGCRRFESSRPDHG
jgi:hypothetical protein